MDKKPDFEFHAAQGDQSPYLCGECNEPVFMLENERIYRPCGHEKAVVIANMEAIVYGVSRIKNEFPKYTTIG